MKNYGALETGVHGLHLATNVLLDGGYQLLARHWPAAGLVMVELQMFGKATSANGPRESRYGSVKDRQPTPCTTYR